MVGVDRLVLQSLVTIKNACMQQEVKSGIIDNLSDTIFLMQKILKYDAPRTIGFFGAQKRGKSSLINQLLGCRLMPESPTPMSSVVIQVRCDPLQEDHLYTVEILFANGYRDTSTVDLEQAQTLLKEYGSHRGSSSEDVDRIMVSSRFPQSQIIGQGGVLVDTPGAEVAFEVPEERNKADAERAKKILSDMHIVIFVERADMIQSFNSHQFFAEYLKPMRPLGVVNWKDTFDLDSSSVGMDPMNLEAKKQTKLREKMLQTYGINLDRVLCVSCKEAKLARSDSNAVNQNLLEQSCLPQLERRILHELKNLSPEVGVVTCLLEMQKILSQLDTEKAIEVFSGAKRPFYVMLKKLEDSHSNLKTIIRDIYEEYH